MKANKEDAKRSYIKNLEIELESVKDELELYKNKFDLLERSIARSADIRNLREDRLKSESKALKGMVSEQAMEIQEWKCRHSQLLNKVINMTVRAKEFISDIDSIKELENVYLEDEY